MPCGCRPRDHRLPCCAASAASALCFERRPPVPVGFGAAVNHFCQLGRPVVVVGDCGVVEAVLPPAVDDLVSQQIVRLRGWSGQVVGIVS